MPYPRRGSTRRLLIVEDDHSMGTFATRVLRRAGFDTTNVPTGEEALQTLRDGSWDGLLTDVQLPGMSGLELAAAARVAHPALAIAVMTAYSSVDMTSSSVALQCRQRNG